MRRPPYSDESRNSLERVRAYAKQEGPSGLANKANLNYWSGRASANSQQGTRAPGGEVKLRDTCAPPRKNSKAV
jgi:hypothetical protein